MGTAILRHARLGIILLVIAAALVAAWVVLNHAIFVVAACLIAIAVVAFVLLRDGLRQTSMESLTERGIYPEFDGSFALTDPGLRREMAPIIPSTVRRPNSGGRRQEAPSAPRARLSAPSGRAAKPARSGKAPKHDETLQPGATVTFAAARQAAGIDDLIAALDRDLIGLAPVKQKIEEIGALLLIDRARHRFGLSAPRPNLHMCFTGAPGTGKTTVAMMMADLLHQLGYLETNNFVHAMRNDLVGEFIGHTAPKTRRILNRAMGGVLFIDEAYSLFRGEDSKDYGYECLDILMQVMENDRDKIVVILAGYKDPMDRFFRSNPGMSSRIAHHLDFADYAVEELLAIGRLMLDQSSYYLSPQAEAGFRDHLALQMRQPGFANARTVRNALEGARLRHASRLAADQGQQWTKDDLMRLEPPDILPGGH
jgi:probable Rubsico expression protein CbbX